MTRVLHLEGQPGFMDVVVVGSLAYDSIQTPAAHGERLLGGSATYAGLASAAQGASCGLVGVVGEDFRDEDRHLLAEAGLHLDGVVTAEGRTFHWEGEYAGAMGEASTLNTELNVFEAFDPEVPAAWTTPSVLFCANLHPALQIKVLDQCTPTRLRMLDSMNLWIDIARPLLVDVLNRVDLVVLNDGEVRMLAEDANLVRAAQFLWSSEVSTACLPCTQAACFTFLPCPLLDLWTRPVAGTASQVRSPLISPRGMVLWVERSSGLGSSARLWWRVSPFKASA